MGSTTGMCFSHYFEFAITIVLLNTFAMNQDRRKFLSQLSTVGMIPLMPDNMNIGPEDELAETTSYKGVNKVGFNLLLWTAGISEKLNPLASKLKEIGYDGIEVVIGEPSTQPYIDLGKYVKSLDLEISTVMVVGKDENPISESAAIRQKAVDRLK